MKFSIFSGWEIINKAFRIIVTIIISVVTVLGYFLGIKDSQAGIFLLSTGYALFLFVIGVYATYRNQLVENRFIRRAESYVMLKKMEELFRVNNDYSSVEGMTKTVIGIRVFTGRTEKQDKSRAVVRENGFCFLEKLTVLEQLFLDEKDCEKKEKYRHDLEKLYAKYHKKTKQNILRIENLYGDRLKDYLYSDEQVLDMLSVLERKIDEIDNRLSDIETAIEEKDYFSDRDRKDISALFTKVVEELDYIEDRLENGLGD